MAGVYRGEVIRGGRSYGNGGFGATELERGCGVPRRPPGVALSTVVCSVAALGDSGHGGDMNGGEELRPWWWTGLRRANG